MDRPPGSMRQLGEGERPCAHCEAQNEQRKPEDRYAGDDGQPTRDP